MHAEAVVYKELVSSSAAATLVGKANTTASLTLLPNTHRYDGILVVAHEGAPHRTIVKTTYTHTQTHSFTQDRNNVKSCSKVFICVC